MKFQSRTCTGIKKYGIRRPINDFSNNKNHSTPVNIGKKETKNWENRPIGRGHNVIMSYHHDVRKVTKTRKKI